MSDITTVIGAAVGAAGAIALWALAPGLEGSSLHGGIRGAGFGLLALGGLIVVIGLMPVRRGR